MDWFLFQFNPQFLLSALVRIFLSCVLGGIIGFEREQSRNRPAGFRTHILVCLGACLVMLIAEFSMIAYSGKVNIDPTRIGAQVVSGIGFLGAGTIIRHGLSVKGITTAASIWVVACVGLACGVGFYTGAVLVTLLIWTILMYLKNLEIKLAKHNTYKTIEVEGEKDKQVIYPVSSLFRELNIEIKALDIYDVPKSNRQRILLQFDLDNKDLDLTIISAKINEIEGILKVSL
ncbi:MAG TPA: MgtC/SapB family protein [Clostridiaceae bacterium]|jgi:putative Mg2+ transporter-C (MgtC) family protein|nr:MgtC/SapB family protein [Clostridiaceae bacterium]